MVAELIGTVPGYEGQIRPHVLYRLTPLYRWFSSAYEYIAIEVMPGSSRPRPGDVGSYDRIVMRWCNSVGGNRGTYFHRIPHTQNPEDGLAYLGYTVGEQEPYDPMVCKSVPLF
jgi:hypothetical protein